MKILYLLLATVLSVGSLLAADDEGAAPDKNAAQVYSKIVFQADHAERAIVDSDRAKGLVAPVVKDRKWIEDFGHILAGGSYRSRLHVFAVSNPLCFVDRDGKCLLSVEVLPGNTLRLNGEDYEVDSDTAGKIYSLLSKVPNKALVPAPGSLTPSADTPVAPSTGAAPLFNVNQNHYI